VQPGLVVVLGDSTGNRYVHAPRGIHTAEDQAGNWQHVMTDALGSVRGYVGEHNAVLSNVNYSEYGVPSTPIVGFAFTGEWRDQTGLQYHRARYLSPALGGWLSLDPWEGMAERIMSMNGYAWVEGGLPNRVDPSGKCVEDTVCRRALRTPGLSNELLRELGCLPTYGCSCQNCLDECDRRYLAHVSAGEASGTNSNVVMAAIMLSQINAFRAGGRFTSFRVIETFLESNNPDELIDLYYDGRTPPESNEDLIQQSEAYNAYRAVCLSGRLATPSIPSYQSALQMAEQMCDIVNPLQNYTVSPVTPELEQVEQSRQLQQENSFCSSVLNKVPEWEQRAVERNLSRSPYVPEWYPGDSNHVIFVGTPRSVVVYSSGGSPVHRNWQCPQFLGQPTVHLRADGQCVKCSGQEVFDSGIYSSCDGGTEEILGTPTVACS